MTMITRRDLLYWLPAVAAGGAAWIAFMLLGHTPLLRASGMALVIAGIAMSLRSMGIGLAVIGALALAFSPYFWIQTGGAEMFNPLHVGAALIAAAVVGAAIIWISKRSLMGVAAAIVLFAALFIAVVGEPRSLRLTTLLTAWLLYLLIDGLLVSNPRPDEPSNGKLGAQHTYGMLLLMIVGVVNDPLFVLLVPAVALGLFLSRKRLPAFYWAALLAVAGFGVVSLVNTYYADFWWNFPVDLAISHPPRVPYLIGTVWREPERWLRLIALVIGQFTAAGFALGILGLARLARWHPPVGVVTMIAFATYALFGLIYFGDDSVVLLLPLLMIEVLWITYAVYTFGQWLQKSATPARFRWLAAASFTLLPLLMLLRIVGMV